MDAYSLLENFENQPILQMLSTRIESLPEVHVWEFEKSMTQFQGEKFVKSTFLKEHFRTTNSFYQIRYDKKVETHIANMGIPYPLYIEPHHCDPNLPVCSSVLDQLQKDKITVYSIKGGQQTLFAISYSKALDSFAFSYKLVTIFCKNAKDLQYYDMRDFGPVVDLTSNFFKKFTFNQLENLAKDLTNRSLIGICNYQTLSFFAIVEHYGSQPNLPFNQVSEFLRHYKLEQTHLTELNYSNKASLKEIVTQVFNTPISEYFEHEMGEFLIFTDKERILVTLYVIHKLYKLIKQISSEAKRPQFPNAYTFLHQYKLTPRQEEFFEQVFDFACKAIKDNLKLSHRMLNSIIYSVHKKSKLIINYSKIDLDKILAPPIFVILPIGLKENGYKQVFEAMANICPEVQVVDSIDEISQQHLIYCVATNFTPNTINVADTQLKRKNFQIRTVGYYMKGSHKTDKFYFPFSISQILFSLSQHSQDQTKLKEALEDLKTFDHWNMKNVKCDELAQAKYLSEKDYIFPELTLDDLNAALDNGSVNALMEDLNEIPHTQLNEEYIYEDAKYLLGFVEDIQEVKLQWRNVKFKPDQCLMGLFIERPDWSKIDNQILDAIEEECDKSKDQKLRAQFNILHGQMIDGKKVVYKREKHLYVFTKNLNKNYAKVRLDPLIFVEHGLLILCANIPEIPQRDIPVYSYNLDPSKADKVMQQLQVEIKKVVKERKAIIKPIKLNDKEWVTYILPSVDIYEVDLVAKNLQK